MRYVSHPVTHLFANFAGIESTKPQFHLQFNQVLVKFIIRIIFNQYEKKVFYSFFLKLLFDNQIIV